MNLIDFIHDSNRCKTIDELKDTWSKFLSEFGIERFIIGNVSHETFSEIEDDFGKLTTYPHEWIKHYKENHYAEHDPVLHRAIRSRRPFTWTEIQQEDISEQGSRMMNEAGEYQLKAGIGFSIHLPPGRIIGFGLSGPEIDIRCDKDALSLLHAASQQFITVYADLTDIDPLKGENVRLTPREGEVLSWIARGKTKAEIGEILQVSESTIKRHCEKLLKKFNANNLTSTVTKALRMGLINPY